MWELEIKFKSIALILRIKLRRFDIGKSVSNVTLQQEINVLNTAVKMDSLRYGKLCAYRYLSITEVCSQYVFILQFGNTGANTPS